MDNLKYPKVSYLHNEASEEDVFDIINSKHVWKEDGHILDDTSLKHKSITNLGVSTGNYLQVTKAVRCPINCEFQVGFSVKREYRTPGRGNAYPINHPYARPYFVTVGEEEVVSGELTEAAMRKIELEIMALIQSDVEHVEEAQFFNARKVAYTSGAGDISITDSDGNVTTVTLAEGDLLGGEIIAVSIATDEYMLVGARNGYYFAAESDTATVVSQGIAIIGNRGEVHLEVKDTINFVISPFYLYQVYLRNGNACIKSYYESGSFVKFEATDHASLVAGFEDSGKLSAVDSPANNSIIVTSGTENPSNYVDLPVDTSGAPAYTLGRLKAVAGNGTWPTNTWKDVDRKFIGRYTGMQGVYEIRAIKGSHYAVMQYIIEGSSPGLSSGASSSESFNSKVDEYLSFDAIRENPELATIFSTI
jgi:hypothetical protein